MEPETLKEHFQAIFQERNENIKEYCIAQEEHKDEGKHLHAYLRLTKQLSITNQRFFDLTIEANNEDYNENENENEPEEDVTYHPNIQKVKNYAKVLNYVQKDNNFITNIPEKEFNNSWKQAVALAQSGDTTQAIKTIIENNPRDYLINGTKIKENLVNLSELNVTKYSKESFNVPPDVINWLNNYKNYYCLWLFGPSQIGKTSLALALFDNPLLVRHLDQLKSLKPEHDCIIFDDMNFIKQDREMAIALTDMEQPSGINVKHGMVVIPKGLPKIFCSNVHIWPTDYSSALRNRIAKVNLTEAKLYKAEIIISKPQLPKHMLLWEKNELISDKVCKRCNHNGPKCTICQTYQLCSDCGLCLACDKRGVL